MRGRRSQATIAAVAFALGLLVVVQLRTQAGGAGLDKLSVQDLTVLVANLNARNDHLRTEVATLERQLADLETGRRRGVTSAGQIEADLRRIRAWAGLDPVAGRGVTVTVSGPVAGPAIEELVNELWNAGAEAVAIEEVRVVPGTVVGGVEGAVSVDDTALADPFSIRAIGAPEALVGSLTRMGGVVAQLAATWPDAIVDVEATERMVLPATTRSLVPGHGQPRL